MPTVLIVAEQQPDGALRKATLNALTAGQQLAQKASAELHVVVLGKNVTAAADELKAYGPKVVHAASAPALEHYLAETFAPAVAELAQTLKADFVGAASTAMGKDLMPRVAARLKAVDPLLQSLVMLEPQSGEASGPRVLPTTPSIQKPFTLQALADKVREVLDSGEGRA